MFYPKKQISVTGLYGLIDTRKAPNFHFDGETHPFWELVYIKDGNVGVSADERIYNLSKGDVIFHKPMEFHRIWSTENSSPALNIITFEAEGENVKELENLTVKLDEVGIIMLERCVDMGKKAFTYNRGAMIVSVNDEKLCQEYCNQLEIFLLSLMSRDISKKLPTESSSSSKLFADVVLYLRENLGEKMTVEKIADRFFVSPSRIKKLFLKYSGLGVISYFNNMKILEAQILLREGSSASEVAERLGFSNQFYFSSVFKKITGMTPSEYKRKDK